jgi:hypothetical protein
MSVYFICNYLKVSWSEITATEGENRFGKGELLEEYNYFVKFSLQPP